MSDHPDHFFPPSPLAHAAIEAIWLNAAAEIGWRVERGTAAYASTDGRGTMSIGSDDVLDPHDAVAQLVFHELCHGIVQGPAGWSAPDWGLSNEDDQDVAREHACLRVQIHLAEPHGLRELMAPTTDYRSYHDAITGDPLKNDNDVAAALAGEAVLRRESTPLLQIVGRALCLTRATLDAWAVVAASGGPMTPADAPALHPVGLAFADHSESCGTCAWRYRGGRGRPVDRCRQSAAPEGDGRRTEARFRACVRWEPQVDCLRCGACCREAYHSVTLSVRDPVVWKQPELIVRNGHRFEILRSGDRCAALAEDARKFACTIYDDRPRTCREFEAGGRHCLVARRRVGLSP